MELLDLSPSDFVNPVRFARFQSVATYLKQFPEDTQRFLITKSTRGKVVDRLDHVFEYTNLLKQKFAQEKTLERLKEELSAMEAIGDPQSHLTQAQSEEMDAQLNRTLEEIQIYE
jgi:hypothetical protein